MTLDALLRGGLLAQPLLAVLAALLSLFVPARARNAAAGLAVAALGIAGAVAGTAALLGAPASGGLVLGGPLPAAAPLQPLTLAPDAIGGLFMLIAGVVVALASVFGIGYAHGPVASRTGWCAFALFALGMQLVPAAADAVTFLLAWELMAGGSTVLLLADHVGRPQVRRATLWYAVMTHLSFLFLIAGFGVLAASADGTTWTTIAAARIGGGQASVAFTLLLAGFATKAGLVPVHVWLPRAHPEAPSHVSAAMSAAMVKMGIYGIWLVTLRLLPAGPAWWAVLLVAVGVGSALYGILQASVQSDLKRLLAYSTTENVGLITTAIGVGELLQGAGQPLVGRAALMAALLLAVSHAAFKTVLFLGAGAVLQATGERDLDSLGGLASRMPWTATAFGVGAMGAAALPVTSGFVAEWVLLQALVHSDARADRLVAIAMPLTMGIVALTIGLGLLTFVKAFGIAFLARPRTPSAAAAREVAPSMRVALVLAAVLVVALGLFPGPVGRALARPLGLTVGGGLGLALPVVGVALHPLALILVALVLALPALAVNTVLARRRPRRDVDLAWGCGADRSSPRMEYNATSYTEPLLRIFAPSLKARRDFSTVSDEDAPLLIMGMSFQSGTSDIVEDSLYLPATRAAQRLGDLARTVQNGSIHRYMGFSFTALIVVLVVVSL